MKTFPKWSDPGGKTQLQDIKSITIDIYTGKKAAKPRLTLKQHGRYWRRLSMPKIYWPVGKAFREVWLYIWVSIKLKIKNDVICKMDSAPFSWISSSLVLHNFSWLINQIASKFFYLFRHLVEEIEHFTHNNVLIIRNKLFHLTENSGRT